MKRIFNQVKEKLTRQEDKDKPSKVRVSPTIQDSNKNSEKQHSTQPANDNVEINIKQVDIRYSHDTHREFNKLNSHEQLNKSTDSVDLSPNSIEQFNATKVDVQSKSLSHEELLKRLDSYTNRSPWDNNTSRFHLLKLKQDYLSKLQKDGMNRTAQDIQYGFGLRYGLPHAPHSQIQLTRLEQDQNSREETLGEAKEYYKKNLGLNKDFNNESMDLDKE